MTPCDEMAIVWWSWGTLTTPFGTGSRLPSTSSDLDSVTEMERPFTFSTRVSRRNTTWLSHEDHNHINCFSTNATTAVFNGRFPHAVGLPGPTSVFTFGWQSSRKVAQVSLQTRYPYCHPTNTVKTLKETQSTDPNQGKSSTSLNVHSSSTNGLREEGALLPLCWFSDAVLHFHMNINHGHLSKTEILQVIYKFANV